MLTPVLYATNNPGARFQTLAAISIPRLYHSTANLLPDGRILIAGSNTHQYYTLNGTFPTELRTEAYSPPYLSSACVNVRPQNVFAPGMVGNGTQFSVLFRVQSTQDAHAQAAGSCCELGRSVVRGGHGTTEQPSGACELGARWHSGQCRLGADFIVLDVWNRFHNFRCLEDDSILSNFSYKQFRFNSLLILEVRTQEQNFCDYTQNDWIVVVIEARRLEL